MEADMFFAITSSILLVFIACFVFYEILYITFKVITRYDLRARPFMFLLVGMIFAAHTIIVWGYAAFYWAMVHYWDFKPLSGAIQDNFFDYIYFSAATYSSLGIGDVYPHGALRFITGVQVLNGLILIGWSVTVSYFAVQKLWDTHLKK